MFPLFIAVPTVGRYLDSRLSVSEQRSYAPHYSINPSSTPSAPRAAGPPEASHFSRPSRRP
eukprot:552595-Prorocentrum_minimum.AAC.1